MHKVEKLILAFAITVINTQLKVTETACEVRKGVVKACYYHNDK